MTDKEILDEVYRRLVDEKQKYHTALPSPIISFIEQEWQRRDEKETVVQYNRNREVKDHVSTVDEIDYKSLGQFSETWYKDDKRHRELKIESDGTVRGLL